MTQIEEIKSKLPIEQVIGEYLPLRQAGLNWKGLCPFHKEKSPSFMVSQDKQIWHCFGCNEGGDVITFVQKYESLEFKEALQLLATKAGVALTGYTITDQSKKKILNDILQASVEYYEGILWADTPAAKKTREYLISRGLSEATIRAFHLGLAPDSWDGLMGFLQSKGYILPDIQRAGLVIIREQKTYDRFRRRLMFPIADAQGKVVAFTARTLQYIAYQDDDQQGKYVNSPGTELYLKSQILYGFDKAKHAIKRQGYAIIVEGNMDTIMSHQCGIENAVAVSGTALTHEQLKSLKRYTDNIILAFDADAAGSAAVFRGVTLAWEFDMNVKVIVLTDGKDPADVVAKDPGLWREAIKNSIGVVDFYIDAIFKRVDLSRADHKKLAVKKIVGIINKLTTRVEQEHYVTLLAKKLQMHERVVWDVVQAPTAESDEVVSDEVSRPESRRGSEMYTEHLLSFIVQYPDMAGVVFDELEPEMVPSDVQELYKKMIVQYTSNQFQNFVAFSSMLSPDELRRWSELVFQGERLYQGLAPHELPHELERLLARTIHAYYTTKLQELTEAIKRAEEEGSTSEVAALLEMHQQISKKRARR